MLKTVFKDVNFICSTELDVSLAWFLQPEVFRFYILRYCSQLLKQEILLNGSRKIGTGAR